MDPLQIADKLVLFDPETIKAILGLAVSFFLSLFIKFLVEQELSWWRFKRTDGLGVRSWVQYSTPVGAIKCQITRANRWRMVLESHDDTEIIYVPMYRHELRDWRTLKTSPTPTKKKSGENT